MAKQSKGRVGVAPSRERCPVCGDRAALHQTRDDNQMCHPCLERYEAFCDREAAGFLGDEECGPATEIAPLPEMTTCAYCGYLAVGYCRDGGMFVCSECWAHQEEQRTHCPEIEQEEPVPDALAPWYRAITRWALDDSRHS